MIKQLMGRAGMKIRAGDGCEELGHAEMLSTPLFYYANPGDKITLLNTAYKFNIATYRSQVEQRWIYTYDYAPDQNWTIYNGDLSGDSYRQKEYIFENNVYFRICLRKVNGEFFDGTEDINKILAFHETSTLTPAVKQGEKKQWIIDEAQRVVNQVNDHRENEDNIFILLTDTHYNVNGTWDDTSNAIDQICQEIKPNGIIHLGDMTDGMVTGAVTKHYVKIILSDLKSHGIPVWITLGNHDTNYFRKNPEPFTDEQIKELYFNNNEKRYYIDLPAMRLIFLDSYDYKEEFRYGYSNECVSWLESILESTPLKSKVLVFSHLPPVTRLQFWTNNLRGENEITEILNKHTNKIIAWINGHNHADRLDSAENYPIVSIANAKCEAFTEIKTEGFITPERKLNDITQEAFDILIVNPEKEAIRFIRFGAGKDRIIKNGKAQWV